MRMLQGPVLFRTFAGSWRFEPHNSGAVKVIFHYVFETRWRWLRWLLDPLVCGVFRRDVRARLRGLKRGAEQRGLLDRLGAGCG
jgi:ribosome-associated toxin RatA of RatAB toxin-antitoxin module